MSFYRSRSDSPCVKSLIPTQSHHLSFLTRFRIHDLDAGVMPQSTALFQGVKDARETARFYDPNCGVERAPRELPWV